MKTKWSLNELGRYQGEPLMLSGKIDVEDAVKNRNERVLAIEPVQYDGALSVDKNEYILDVTLDYKIVLPSTRSLEPTTITMNLPITEIYLPPNVQQDPEESNQEALTIELEYDWIDLKETLVDNILAALPFKVLTEEEEKGNEEMPSGKNWKVLSDDEPIKNQADSEGDPRFAVLKSLFEDNADSQKED